MKSKRFTASKCWSHTTYCVLGPLSVNIPCRSIFLPYKLTPGLVEFTDFQEGRSNFQVTVYLATGKNKSKRVSAPTLKKVLNQLSSGIKFDCVLRFSTAWYKPYQQLCSVETSFGEIYTKYNSGSTDTSTGSLSSRRKRNNHTKK